MKVIKLKYNGFIFVWNPCKEKYIDFRPCDVYHMKDVHHLLAALGGMHPRCELEVVHGKNLTSRQLDFLRARPNC